MARAPFDYDRTLKVNKQISQICAFGWMITAAALLSCQAKKKKMIPVIDTRITCNHIKPITYVDSDSTKTKEQIVIHNEVWDKLCLGEEKQ